MPLAGLGAGWVAAVQASSPELRERVLGRGRKTDL